MTVRPCEPTEVSRPYPKGDWEPTKVFTQGVHEAAAFQAESAGGSSSSWTWQVALSTLTPN